MEVNKILYPNTEKRDSTLCRVIGHKLRSSVVIYKSMDPSQSNLDFLSLWDVSCARCRNYADIDSSIDGAGQLKAYAKMIEKIVYGEGSPKIDGSSMKIRAVRVSYERKDIMRLAPAKRYYDLERGSLVDNRRAHKEFLSNVTL